MKIVLHILLKDLRHHWKEIALFVLTCGAWGWATIHPLSWISQREFLPIALIGLWMFITIRVVHGECLVSDREFWQTRPYTGVQLLLAKTLFLVLCLNVPLLIVQVILLMHAGFSLNWALISGLIFLELALALYVTFPTFALAAVTESFIQWILWVGALFLFALVLSWLPWDKLPNVLTGQENIGSLIGFALAIPALFVAIIWQYTRRNVGLARLAIGLAAMAIPVAILIAHAKSTRSIAYRHSDGATPFQLSMRPQDGGDEHEYFRTKSQLTDDSIYIPINFVSTDADLSVDVEGFRVLLSGDNGWKWQSPWLNRSLTLSPRSPGGGFEFPMSSQLADQIPHAHAVAGVEVAYVVHQLGHAEKIDTSPQRFSIPGVGFCRWIDKASGEFSISGYSCFAPLRLPGMSVAEIESGDLSCKDEKGEPPIPAGHYASSTEYGTDAMPAVGLNPVHEFHFDFGKWYPAVKSALEPKDDRKASLCRGTPIMVRIAAFAGRRQSKFDLGPMGTEQPGTADEEGTVRFNPEAQ